MRILLKMLPIFLLLPVLAKGQSNYKPGYIVDHKGDTVKGYIDYREWGNNPKQFIFKKTLGSDAERYNTNNCAAFGIIGFEYFQKFVVPVSKNPIDPTRITSTSDTSSVTDTVFLVKVTEGKNVTLYEYTDLIKSRFYIAEKDQSPVELILKLKINVDDDNKIITQAIYKNQLRHLAYAYLPNDQKLIMQINNANYDQKDLRGIVNLINGPGNYARVETADMNGVGFFAGISIANTQTKVSGDFDFSGQSHNEIVPAVDLGINFFSNKNIGEVVFRVELGFTGNKANFTETTQGGSTTTMGFNQFITYLNPQVLYNFYNTKPLKVYAEAGLVANYSAFSNKSYIYQGSSAPAEDLTAIVFPDVTPLYFTVSGKVGVIVNSTIDIHIGYLLPTNINDNQGYSVKTTQYALGINYLFGAK